MAALAALPPTNHLVTPFAVECHPPGLGTRVALPIGWGRGLGQAEDGREPGEQLGSNRHGRAGVRCGRPSARFMSGEW